ncbi:TonB family protein [Azohydromonas sp. G-1-1-14]|uniref:TonB family protein n=1 Tax=Azohydromonas caseinilytica TaxID=2728836 RepID=A0A848FA11_9BURK|nr:TonB family protein [Azohydromonas caseinilytica]
MRLPALSPLQWALGVSLLAHAGLLGLRLADPQGFARLFKDAPLEVVLVNAQAQLAPKRPQALAQHNLAGGGDAEAGRATSPLPAAALEAPGESSEDAQRRIEQLQQQQRQLLALAREALAQMPRPDPQRDQGQPQAQEQEERHRQLLRHLAEIERRVNEDNARPRRRYVSPATREVPYARYYDALRHRVEARGTQDFPQAEGKKLYGELTMALTVDARGQLLETKVLKPSGQPLLDRRAEAIARAAGPYGLFDTELRALADLLVITARFRFTREDGVQAVPMGGAP